MPVARTLALWAAAAAPLLLAAPAGAELKAGDRAPELVGVVDAEGRRVSLKQFGDRVTVLTFGASWCAPCKKELPAYERLARAYARQKARVLFVAVSIDTEAAKARRFFEGLRLRAMRTVFDPKQSTVKRFDPPKMPTTFVIQGGIIRHVHAGYVPGDETKLRRVIDSLVGTGSRP